MHIKKQREETTAFPRNLSSHHRPTAWPPADCVRRNRHPYFQHSLKKLHLSDHLQYNVFLSVYLFICSLMALAHPVKNSKKMPVVSRRQAHQPPEQPIDNRIEIK
jgi:hypothetical protein